MEEIRIRFLERFSTGMSLVKHLLSYFDLLIFILGPIHIYKMVMNKHCNGLKRYAWLAEDFTVVSITPMHFIGNVLLNLLIIAVLTYYRMNNYNINWDIFR